MNDIKKYHIQFTLKEAKPPHKRRELVLDLSAEELEKRYLLRYREGRSIVANGRVIEPNNIDRTRVYHTSRNIGNLGSIPWGMMHDVTNEFITGPSGHGVEPSSTAKQGSNSPTSMKVFISHSSIDVDVARLLVELLRKALNLKSQEIRCTSVDGYRMPGGASVDETLRVEVHDAELLIGIVTPASLKSAYVMFELGARWGAGKRMIPLLASGATPNHLGGPLAGLNALDASQIGQLYQLLEEAAQHLSVDLEKASSYAANVEELAKSAVTQSSPLEQEPANASTVQLSEDAKELLIEAGTDPNGIIFKIQSLAGVGVQTNSRQFVEIGNRRSEAKWEQAIEDLFEEGLIDDPAGKESVFKLTHRGFQLVDSLTKQG